MSELKSKAPGELSVEDEKTRSDTPYTGAEPRPNISGMLESIPNQATSPIGFQATKPSKDSEETTNARIISTFADKLGALVEWQRLTLKDGREVYALCFPVRSWEISPNGELQPVRSVRNDE